VREYVIKRVNGTPDWDQIPAAPIDHQLWDTKTDITAGAQLAWDDDAIYVRMFANETEIRRELTGVLDSVCDDSCLEFFLQPTETVSYINVEMNPNCAVFLGFGSCLENLIRLIPEDWDPLQPTAEVGEDHWSITYRVPVSMIRQFYPTFEPKSGLRMKGNFYKCGDSTSNPHFISWNKVGCDTPAFHAPAYFGAFVLG
jgi:hypothetical protein